MPKNCIVATNQENLFLIPSSVQLAGAEIELDNAKSKRVEAKGLHRQYKRSSLIISLSIVLHL